MLFSRAACCLVFISMLTTIQAGKKQSRRERNIDSRKFHRIDTRSYSGTQCLQCRKEDNLTFEECLINDQYEECTVDKPDCMTELWNEDGNITISSQCEKYQTCKSLSESETTHTQCGTPPIVVIQHCRYCCSADNLVDDYCAPPGFHQVQRVAASEEYGCTEEEIAYEQYCFVVKETVTTFHDAREWCISNGYRLVNIGDANEYAFLRGKLQETEYMDPAYWTGARVRDATLPNTLDSNWLWLDGHDWNWNLEDIFYPFQPRGYPDDEYCGCGALVETNDNYNYYLSDQKCTDKMPFIGKRNIVSPLAERWLTYHSWWKQHNYDCKCYTWGDQHYSSFDGVARTYEGNCTYVHVLDKLHNPALFMINVKTQFMSQNPDVSVVHHVVIKVNNHKITINRGKVVWVDDYPVTLPHTPFGGHHIMISGKYVLFISSHGFWVKYDGHNRLAIGVSHEYRGHTAGVCGICDGDKTNDDLKQDGQHADSDSDFINSWNIDGSCDGTMTDELQDELSCSSDEEAAYSGPDACGIITDPAGPFAACHQASDPAFPFQACVYDMCHVTTYNDEYLALCDSLSNYHDVCNEAGVILQSFRSEQFCPLECPSHSHYSQCMSTCPATCVSADDCTYKAEQCVEGCECDINYVQSGNKCVHHLNCGCIDDHSNFHANGETWITSNCHYNCTCNGLDDFTCMHIGSCPLYSQCTAVQGQRQCECIAGYEWNEDNECIDIHQCNASDPQFLGYSYKIVNTPIANFEDAGVRCRDDGYELASTLSEVEYAFIRQTLKLPEYKQHAYWVGADGQDSSKVGTIQTSWHWTNGDLWSWPLQDIFTEGTPDNVRENEFCGALMKSDDYYMDDKSCSTEYGYICKKVCEPLYARWEYEHAVWRDTQNDCRCNVFGDPHYKTFDGKDFHFQGNGTYVLIIDWAHTNDPLFIVTAKNEIYYEGAEASLVQHIVVRAHGVRVLIKRRNIVLVDDIEVTLPYSPHPGIYIFLSGKYVMVLTDLGVWVKYDGIFRVTAGIDIELGGTTRGMCGICDSDPVNDFSKPDGALADGPLSFGNSWLVEGSGVAVTHQEPICPTNNAAAFYAEDKCGRLSDTLGHFTACHAVISPLFQEESCVFDMCHALDADARNKALCDSLSTYYDMCRDEYVDLPTFRTNSFCVFVCPEWSFYNPCMTTCPATCMSPDDCEYKQCVEGCECIEGYVLSGKNCVPKYDCGCIDEDNVFHETKDTWVTSDCYRECTCTDMDTIVCEDFRDLGCQLHSHCAGLDGIYTCQCDVGYIDHDGVCVEDPDDEFDCQVQCGGRCRYQSCAAGEMNAPSDCYCHGSPMNTCCIDDPNTLQCTECNGECRSDCLAGEEEASCDCNGGDGKCCIAGDVDITCELSCHGECREHCQHDEVVMENGCTCPGSSKCCVHNPYQLSCVHTCGGTCRDLCEDGETLAVEACQCSLANQVCCKEQGWMIGDPHILTFSGTKLQTQDLCSYILVQTDRFTVIATTREMLYIGKEATNVNSIIIRANGHNIHLMQGKQVQINHEDVTLRLDRNDYIDVDDDIRVSYIKAKEHVAVYLRFGLDIFWDGRNAVKIDKVGESLDDNVDGLFGIMSDKPDHTDIKRWEISESCREKKKRHVDY